ncbi:MAG: peptide chain release factor N(5)-glutamine methyltransferase [Solobacterium sp.]|nr:peptide chain release factor N(5)-glutamine methyltransferase [Solobacterium sp.]
MSTFFEIVKEYEKKCETVDVPTETVMAFLVELSQKERYNLYLHYEEEMPKELENAFREGMERILNQEPMAHVLGYSWFYGYKMKVSNQVLIPREETEELCAKILSRIDYIFPKEEKLLGVDVGSGSGAIAITLVKEEARLQMVATDISSEALKVVKENAKENEASITFIEGDMLKPLIKENYQLDILVCNPPYIPEEEVMEKSVVDYEPHVALFGGEDGLKFYRSVFEDCKKVLKEKSFMAFEMGWNQKEALSNLVEEYLPEATYEVVKDMNGKDRMLFVYFNCSYK